MRNNLAVLRLLRTLDEEQRPVTAEEQQVLARWSGWGAVPNVFDARKSEFTAERAELMELLSAEGYEAAKTNTLNAHYTDAQLVRAIWQGMRDLGFEGGNVLEPGCGSGNFIGFAPTDTSTPTRMVGVEVDPTSAAIAAHLYPDAQILGESFAETIAPDGAFDGVVGNVPFGSYWLYDARYNKGQESIHNHFIAKSLEMTRPGGVVALITSHWTMDAEDPSVREALASKADLVGAVRLPLNAHSAAAGTRVVTDVLFLRRREPDRAPDTTSWAATRPLTGSAGTVQVNEYFLDHPERVVGTMGVRMGQFGPEVDVEAPAGESTGEDFALTVGRMVSEARERGLAASAPGADWEPLTLAGAHAARMDGLMQVDEHDKLTVIRDGVQVEIDPPYKNQRQELFTLLRMRDVYLELVEAERTRPVGDEHIEQLRARLNDLYDGYVATYGPINRFDYAKNGRRSYPKLGGIRQDLLATRVLALEHFNPDTQSATKADIFHKRTIVPPTPPTSAATPADALSISLDLFNEVRLDEIRRLMGSESDEQARQALGSLVFDEPVTERLVPAPEYLSGDVRAKMKAAQAAAATDERFTANVEALAEVIPDDLTPAEIEARLGAAWISAEHVQQFARELLDDSEIRVENPGGSHWRVSGGRLKSVLTTQTWGTQNVPAQVLLQNILQNKSISVTYTVEDDDGRKRSVLDVQATEAAQAKAAEMQERFSAWAWEDPDRARELARLYNERFNCLALRTYTGDHLTFPGLSQEFEPREHQRAAVARVLAEPATLLAHGVGAGKTAEMVISIMEMRRLGQARKPAMVVPNHMLEQVSREFAELYPQAKILVADKDKMSRDYRQKFADMAASGDWDVVVFGHHQFKNLPLSNEARQEYEDRQVAEYEAWIEAAQDDPDVHERTVKQLQRAKVQLQNRYRKLMADVDAGSATLEDCGIDALVIDEAHEHKNALVRSNIQDAAKENPSWMAEDLMMKCDYMRKSGGKIVFSTATPIANSVAEAYVITRFLRPDLLHRAEIYDFDTWASTFGEVITETEMKPEGGFRQKDRFARFINIPELLRTFHTFADVKLADELGLERPQVVRPEQQGSQVVWVEGRETAVVEPSQELLDYMKKLGKRAEDIRNGTLNWRWSKAKRDWRPDNMLWVSNDGRFAATDMRLVEEEPPDHTKIMEVAEKVHQIWEQHKDDVYTDPITGEPEPRTGSLQMVFSDLGTPNNDPSTYDAYADLREQLVAKGMPRDQIRFVHEANNDQQKGELFASCRDGRTQVIIGSTKKMGTGTNIQRRAVALHHVDCPWRPVDIEQREGRLVRQKNANTQVRVLAYVTEKSFDAFMWQTALRKARFIDQVMRGRLDVREIEDVSATAMSYAQVQALASGNPLMLERAQNEALVTKLERLQRAHAQGQVMLRRTITAGRQEIERAQAALEVFDRALQRRSSTRGDDFTMTVDDKGYDKRTDAADALRRLLGAQVDIARRDRVLMRFGHSFPVGTLGGFRLSAQLTRTGDGDIKTRIVFDDLPGNNLKIGEYATTPTVAYTFPTVDELTSSTGHGVVMSLENTLRDLDVRRSEAAEAVLRIQTEIDRAQNNLGAPFARQEELEAALAEEARILEEMGLPPRDRTALIEGHSEPQATLVDDEVAAAVSVADAAFAAQQSQAPSQPDPPEQTPPDKESEHPGPNLQGARPLGSWRTDSVPQERSQDQPTLVDNTAAETQQGPAEQEPSPAEGSQEPRNPALDRLEERATASIGLLSLPAEQRDQSDEQLRGQLSEALDGLLSHSAVNTVAELVRRANEVDPDHVFDREHHRSRAEYATPVAQMGALEERVLRLEDDLSVSGAGVVRNIGGDSDLRSVLEAHGFKINPVSGVGLLLLDDPQARLRAWSGLLTELDDNPQMTGRITEQQWQHIVHEMRSTAPQIAAEPEQRPGALSDLELRGEPEAVDLAARVLYLSTQLSLPEEQRPGILDEDRSTAQLRTDMAVHLTALADMEEHEAVLALLGQAVIDDPDSAAHWERLRSRSTFPTPQARAAAVERQVLRVDTGSRDDSDVVFRNLPPADTTLHGILENHGFVVLSSPDGPAEARMPGQADQQEQQAALNRVLSALTFIGINRIEESVWQEATAEARDERRAAELERDEQELAAQQEPEQAVQGGASEFSGSSADPAPPPETGQRDGSEAPSAEPEEQASDDPAATAKEALERLQRTYDSMAAHSERRTVQRSIDYLIEAGEEQQALDLINAANQADPATAWDREEQRGRLVWQGEEAEQRALDGPVIRIEHDGARNTVVRGTSKDDQPVRDVLKDLKFRWSRRYEMWHLRSNLNGSEQRRRVSELLRRLDQLGRDRIAEPLWQEIRERADERERAASQDVVEQLRPAVEAMAQDARQNGTHRQALTTIDDLHRRMRDQGHYRPGDVPGTGQRAPYQAERDQLREEARERAKEILPRYRTIMSGEADLAELRDAQALFEEAALCIPPEDLNDEKLEKNRAMLQRRIEQAEAEAEPADEEQHEAQEQQAPEVVEPEQPTPATEATEQSPSGETETQEPSTSPGEQPSQGQTEEQAKAAEQEPAEEEDEETAHEEREQEDADQALHRDIELLRPAVEEIMLVARQNGTYHYSLQRLDALDEQLREAGHHLPEGQHHFAAERGQLLEAMEQATPLDAEVSQEETAREQPDAERTGDQQQEPEAPSAQSDPEPEEETAPSQQSEQEPQAPAAEAVEQLRPEVEEAVQTARRMSTYRQALIWIDGLHQDLIDQGHYTPGEALPFAAERDALLQEARERTDTAYAQARSLLEGDSPQRLRAALVLLEEMEVSAPPEDYSDTQFTAARTDLLQRIERRVSPDQEVPDRPPEGAEPHEVDAYDDAPDDLYEEHDPDPIPPDAYPEPAAPPRPRAGIDISGVEPYRDRAAAERATWWIEQHGIARWAQTTTAAEMAAPRSLPPDDAIALDQALHQVREEPLEDGPGAAAARYADLGGAATAVFERIDDDRLHLAQVAELAAGHAARLHATREYNLARMRGASPEQLARLEQRQEALRYTGAEEAREASEAIAVVVGRWTKTATSRQARESFAAGADVERVRQVWAQVADGGLEGGPGPAAARFEGLSRAVGELDMRLEAESHALRQLGLFASKHAARLAATQQAAATPQVQHTPEAQRPPHHRYTAAEQGIDR